MPLPEPRAVFGVHSMTPYNRMTGEFKGILKVLASSTVSLSGELIKLNGGSNKYPWAVEEGLITAEMSLKVREYPDFLYELFLGKTPTTNLAGSAGTKGFANVNGVSVLDAVTGIATLSVLTAANVKFGKYLVKVVSPTTVDVFISTDADFARGASLSYEDGLLKITSAPLTIVASSPTLIPGTGIELDGGSGVIGMTADDTAEFTALPAGDETSVRIGAVEDTFPEFGAIVLAKKRSTDELFELDMFKCRGVGLPHMFEENAWSEPEITVECFYDAAKNGVFDMRTVNA